MISNHRWSLVGVLLVLVCSGCTIPLVKHPLVNPAEAKAEASLYGVYRTEDCPDNIVHWVHVGPAGGDFPAGFVRIISVSQPKERQPKDAKTALDWTTYIGFVERVGKYHVLHLPLPRKAKGDEEKRRSWWDQKWDENEVGAYMVLRLSVGDDVVEMAVLDGEFVKDEIKAKKLTGEVDEKRREHDGAVVAEDGAVTITAGTAELREYFARQIEGKLFIERQWKFTRVK